MAIVPIDIAADRPARRRLRTRLLERVAESALMRGRGVRRLQHPAVLEMDRPPVHPLDQLAIVRRDEHRRAARVDVAKQVHDLERQIGIEIAGRLVGEDELRLVDERARNGDALLLAARQLLRDTR